MKAHSMYEYIKPIRECRHVDDGSPNCINCCFSCPTYKECDYDEYVKVDMSFESFRSVMGDCFKGGYYKFIQPKNIMVPSNYKQRIKNLIKNYKEVIESDVYKDSVKNTIIAKAVGISEALLLLELDIDLDIDTTINIELPGRLKQDI